MHSNLAPSIVLTFVDESFDAVICLNSKHPEIDKIKQLKSIPIFAADGGAIYLLENGIEPDYIIGDLDSFNNSAYANSVPNNKLIYLPDQETNDFEKTLNYARENNYKNLIVFGIHGGEFEHSLNNWSVLSKFSKFMNIVILDLNRYGFCLSQSAYLEISENEIISLIPKGKVKLSTKGLKWELNDEVLELGYREGARNFTLTDKIQIDLIEGELFVFVDSRFPKILKKEFL